MTTEREDAEPRDARISARYRELAREEPPARLDAAILGAARARAPRSAARRWAAPVSIAAVLVLSVLVTTRIHEEAPQLESAAPAPAERSAKPAAPPAPVAVQAKPAGKAAAEAERPAQRNAAKAGPARPAARADAGAQAREKGEPVPFAGRPSGAVAPQAAPAPAAEAEAARPAAPSAAAAAPASPAGALKAAREPGQREAYEESPQKWLEHIARLRAEGRDADADESLARFRRRYPDYRIPEAMRAKVLPR